MKEKIGITACSDPMKPEFQSNMDRLCAILVMLDMNQSSVIVYILKYIPKHTVFTAPGQNALRN